jgi:hypothetical protein
MSQDLFAAVMTGDFTEYVGKLRDEELFLILTKHGFIEHDNCPFLSSFRRPISPTEVAGTVLKDFKYDEEYEINGTIFFDFPGGWNNALFRELYDNKFDIYDVDEDYTMSWDKSELELIEEEITRKYDE